MDTRIDRFLNEHNLSKYRDNFIHFDFATFLNLTRNTITELVSSVSDSAKLYKALFSFINGSEDIDDSTTGVTGDLSEHVQYEIDLSSITNGSSLPEFLEFVPIKKRKSATIIQLEPPSLTKVPKIEQVESVNNEIKLEPEDIELPSLTKEPKIEQAESVNSEIKQELEDIKITEMLSDSENNNEDGSTTDGQLESVENINFETKTDSIITNRKYMLRELIDQMDLKKIRNFDLLILFSSYKIHNSFTDRERTLLSEIIIKEILIEDTEFILHKEDFHNLAKLIVDAFPSESITPYFKTIKYFNRLSTGDRGSLYTAFKKCQAILKINKDTIPPQQIKTENNINEGDTDVESESESGSTELNKSIGELENEFIKSRSKRIKMTESKKSKGKLTTVRYLEMYKVLQTAKGYELIMKDAEFIYPTLKSFVSNFGKIAHNIIQYAKGMPLIDPYVSNLLSYTKKNISEDSQKLMAILLLPYVLPTVKIKRGEKVITTSHLGSAVHFIRLFENEADETKLYEKSFLEDGSFISGMSNVNVKLYGKFDNIYHIAVRVGTTDYTFINPLHAIEAYFKIFLGMNLTYPIHAQHIFYFFGTIAFDVQRLKISTEIYNSLLPFFKIFQSIHPLVYKKCKNQNVYFN